VVVANVLLFSGRLDDADAMTVVAVWRLEDDSPVEPYGGPRRLLEAFLSGLQVWSGLDPGGRPAMTLRA
jgi:hypothetical protein